MLPVLLFTHYIGDTYLMHQIGTQDSHHSDTNNQYIGFNILVQPFKADVLHCMYA